MTTAEWRKTPQGIASAKATAIRHAVKRAEHNRKPESKLQGWRRSLERRYNFSEAEYKAMLAAQGGVCAICEEPPTKERLHVDHNHVTGQVRGLLCRRCNLTLGFWNDEPKRFARAAAYLLDKPAQSSPN